MVSQNCQVDLKGEKKTNENNIGDLWRFYITILDTWLDTGYWIPMWFGQEDIKTLGATTGSLKFPSQFKRNNFSTLLCNLLNNSMEVSNNRLFELLVRGKYFMLNFNLFEGRYILQANEIVRHRWLTLKSPFSASLQQNYCTSYLKQCRLSDMRFLVIR